MAVRQIKVVGTQLRYVDWSNNWRGETGTLAGGSGTAGKIWIEGDRIRYNDNNGATRYLPFEATIAMGAAGRILIHGDWVEYARVGSSVKRWRTATPI